MGLFERVHMPSFGGATGGLDSEPPGRAEVALPRSTSPGLVPASRCRIPAPSPPRALLSRPIPYATETTTGAPSLGDPRCDGDRPWRNLAATRRRTGADGTQALQILRCGCGGA